VLFDKFERYFFDKKKIKTTSVVSYALVHIVNPQRADSFFSIWENPEKKLLEDKKDISILQEYITFCATEINKLFSAVHDVLPSERWTSDSKTKNRFLTTTNLNGLIICLRFLIGEKRHGSREYYLKKLQNLNTFPFHNYHSSQYGRMARDIKDNFFKQ